MLRPQAGPAKKPQLGQQMLADSLSSGLVETVFQKISPDSHKDARSDSEVGYEWLLIGLMIGKINQL